MTTTAPGETGPEQGVRAEVGTIGAVEGLRGVAVLWVIAFHYFILRRDRADDPFIALVQSARPLELVIGNGYLGVDLFFLITGFLLTLPWFRHAALGLPAPSATAFYWRRVRRIVPAYYVQLAGLFLVMMPAVFGAGFWRDNADYVAANVIAHFTFLHYTTPITSASMSLNGALWTLALEFQYYLLLPLLAPFFVRFPWRAAAAMLLVAAAWRWLAAHDLEALVRWEMARGAKWQVPEAAIRHLLATQLPGYLAHFAIGILVGRAWLAGRGRAVTARSEAAWALAALAGLGALYASLLGLGGTLGAVAWLLVPGSMGLAMLALVHGAPRTGSFLLGNPALVFTGRVSYSAYLYHLPVLLVWNFTFREVGAWGFPLYLAFVLSIAWLSFRLVEQPFMKRWKRTPWLTSAAPGASEARPMSSTTTANGDAPSTTTASSSNS